jgi:hypothetical protein
LAGGPSCWPPAPPPPPVTSTHAATNGRCATDGDPSDALQHFSTSDEPPISDPNYVLAISRRRSNYEGCSVLPRRLFRAFLGRREVQYADLR